MNPKTKKDVKKYEKKQKPKTIKTQSDDEQLLIYADIISNFIIQVILKYDEK